MSVRLGNEARAANSPLIGTAGGRNCLWHERPAPHRWWRTEAAAAATAESKTARPALTGLAIESAGRLRTANIRLRRDLRPARRPGLRAALRRAGALLRRLRIPWLALLILPGSRLHLARHWSAREALTAESARPLRLCFSQEQNAQGDQ